MQFLVMQTYHQIMYQAITATADAEGLQHQEHGSISHPHNMSFTFSKDQTLN